MSLLDPLAHDKPIVDPATGFPSAEFLRKWSIQRAIKAEFDSFLIALTGTNVATSLQFRITEATPSAGAEATFALEVRAAEGDDWTSASFLMSALAGGLSRIELSADEILLNGTLVSSGGILTGHLAANAATDADSIAFTVSTMSDVTWRDCASVTRTWSGQRVQFDASISIDNNDTAPHKIRFRITKDGVMLKEFPAVAGRGYVVPAQDELGVPITYDDVPTADVHTYAFQYTNVLGDLTPLDLDGTFRWSDLKR